MPKMTAAWAVSPPAMLSTSFGSTGMMMPIAITSSTTITNMNERAALVPVGAGVAVCMRGCLDRKGGGSEADIGWRQAATAASRLSNTLRPSMPPRSGSIRRSGWGMRPTTRRLSSQMPAMLRCDPFGLASAVALPARST